METNQPSSSGIKWEDKGKGKAINLIGMESNLEVMPKAKRTRSSKKEVGQFNLILILNLQRRKRSLEKI